MNNIPPPTLFMTFIFGLALSGWGIAMLVSSVQAFRKRDWLFGFIFLTFATLVLSFVGTGVWALLTIPGAG